jgi:DNA-directed RNA polymerase specialized sigma24 family protein
MINTVNQETKQYYLTIEGQEITVSEEVYRAYKRPIWAEHKRNDRQKLCQVSDGKGGLKRCTEDCSKCSRTKEGSFLSLDGLEETGYSVEDRSQDVAEIVAEKMLLEELFIALEELDPNSHRICELLMEGRSKREIARLMSIPQSSFEYQFKKLMASLRKRLENYI